MDFEAPNPNDGWVNPRRPLTAMISSGGVAGGEKISPNHPSIVNPNRLAPHPRYGNIISRHPPTAMVSSGRDAGGGKIGPIDHSIVNPHPRSGNRKGCHPPTAMTDGSGGSVGGSSTSLAKPMMNSAAEPTGTRYVYRHPPIGCTSTDPYWIRGGLQRVTSVFYLGGAGTGGVEGEKAESEVELDPVSPMSTYPFKVSTESWAAAEAEAEQWMIDEGLIRSTLSLMRLNIELIC